MTFPLEPCEISTVKSSFPDNLSALCSLDNFYFVSFRMFLKQVKIVIIFTTQLTNTPNFES